MPITTAPPQSPHTQQHQTELKKALNNIKNAYHAGLLSGGITLVATLVALNNPAVAEKTGLNAFALIDVVLIFGLTYGVKRNNRTAAKFLLGYFILCKVIQIASGRFDGSGAFMAVLLIYCAYLGVIGTNALHNLQEREYDRVDFDPADEYDEYDEVASSASAAPVPKTVSKFWVADELVELCNGDRSQAEWLIHQLRVKNPSQDMDWYNELAISQLSNTQAK